MNSDKYPYVTLCENGIPNCTLPANNELLNDNNLLLTQNSPLEWNFMNIKWDKLHTWKTWLFKIKKDNIPFLQAIKAKESAERIAVQAN